MCVPVTIEKLSFTWKRFTSSSTFGARKNGLPKRNVGAEAHRRCRPGLIDGVAERGRSSREYVKWNSFSLFVGEVLNRLTFSTLIFDGPSVPLAEVP